MLIDILIQFSSFQSMLLLFRNMKVFQMITVVDVLVHASFLMLAFERVNIA